MNKQLVPLETAILLKEMGFDWPVTSYIYDGDTGTNQTRFGCPCIMQDMNKNDELTYSQPDLFIVSQWLREVHGLHIALIPSSELAYWKVRVYSSDGYENMTGTFDSHNSALSAGIQYSLNLLKEKK